METFAEHVNVVKIFVDTSSLMHPNARAIFLGQVRESLETANNRLIVPKRVIEELIKLGSDQAQDDDKKILAHQGIKILKELDQKGLIEKRGDENDTTVDNLFQYIFIKYRQAYNLSLITQDIALMVDILSLERSKSVDNLRSISVWAIQTNQLKEITLENAQKRLNFQDGKKFRYIDSNQNREAKKNKNRDDRNMKPKEGKTIQCIDCSQNFILSSAEEVFYKSKDLSIPKRCKHCRKGKKRKKSQQNRPNNVSPNHVSNQNVPNQSPIKEESHKSLFECISDFFLS